MVVYPEGTWYGGITVADVDQILDEHIDGGRPVARLVLDLAEDGSDGSDGSDDQ